MELACALSRASIFAVAATELIPAFGPELAVDWIPRGAGPKRPDVGLGGQTQRFRGASGNHRHLPSTSLRINTVLQATGSVARDCRQLASLVDATTVAGVVAVVVVDVKNCRSEARRGNPVPDIRPGNDEGLQIGEVGPGS